MESSEVIARLKAICETCLGLGVVDDYNADPGEGPYWPADRPCPDPRCKVVKRHLLQ